MMSVLQFPARADAPSPQVTDNQFLVAPFLAYSLPGLQDIAGLILSKLESMDDQAVMAIYDAVYADITNGTTTTEMVMLEEIISDEVARRCAVNGRPVPWAEVEQIEADNDQADPEGAA